MTNAFSYPIICVAVLFSLLCACAPSHGGSAYRQAEDARVDALIAQVRTGESRKEVERTLGHPYKVENDGRDTVMTYVTGPDSQSAGPDDSQRAIANIQALSGVLGALGSFGGDSIGPATQAGSQVIGAGAALNSTPKTSATAEQSTIEVRLRGNKVSSVERVYSGRVGIGASY